jgi:hypothetical protein
LRQVQNNHLLGRLLVQPCSYQHQAGAVQYMDANTPVAEEMTDEELHNIVMAQLQAKSISELKRDIVQLRHVNNSDALDAIGIIKEVIDGKKRDRAKLN